MPVLVHGLGKTTKPFELSLYVEESALYLLPTSRWLSPRTDVSPLRNLKNSEHGGPMKESESLGYREVAHLGGLGGVHPLQGADFAHV